MLLDAIWPLIPVFGLLGAGSLWLYTMIAGHWWESPDLTEIDAGNHVWRRTGWYPERTGWQVAFLVLCLLFLAMTML